MATFRTISTIRHGSEARGAGLVACFVMACAFIALPCTADEPAKLWLYPSDQDPRNGGHIVYDTSMMLMVENVGGGKDDSIAEAVSLIVSVNDPSLITSGLLTLPNGDPVVFDETSFAFGHPIFDCSDKKIPPHDVFPADFFSQAIGDIEAGQSVVVGVEVEGAPGLELHFDATATGWKEKKGSTTCVDVINPTGHDVTMVLAANAEPSCPSVEIEKTAASAGVALLGELVYTIEVTNTGDCELTQVIVTENIPTVDDGSGGQTAAFVVTAVDPAPSSQSDTEISWSLPDPLAPGDTVSFTVTVEFTETLADGQEIENTACVTAAEFEEGSEPACDSFEVAVGEDPSDGNAGSAGFWCNRIRFAAEEKPGSTYTTEEIGLLLGLVDGSSLVFFDPEVVSIVEAAQVMLCGTRGPDAVDKLLRQLLALWLNVVSGRIDPELTLEGLCAGDAQLPEGTDPTLSVEQILNGAEADLIGEADWATLLNWKDIIDFVNNASLADGDGCLEAEQLRVETRRQTRGRRR